MKARVMKPNALEKPNKPYLDLLNDLVWNKNSKNSEFRNFKTIEASNKNARIFKLGLGVALLSGGVFQQYGTRWNKSSSTDFPSQQLTVSKVVTEKKESGKALLASKDTNLLEESVNTMNKTGNLSKINQYLPVQKLNDSSYGVMSDRYNAIYKKIYENKRLIQTEDLQAINSITKSQNMVGLGLMTSSGSIFLSAYSKNLSGNLKMRAFKLGFIGFLASMGAFGHVNWRFSKFLQHVNDKYFYGQSIKEIQDQTLIKTNRPRNLNFEGSSWKLSSKLPSFSSWLKQD